MTTITVYTLSSSEDGRVRYVGQTSRTLNTRLCGHKKAALRGSKSPVAMWVSSVLAAGYELIIASVVDDAVLHTSERAEIARYRAMFFDLLNVSDGGEGSPGYKWTSEQLLNISRVRKGRVISPEWRANISRGQLGRKKPQGHGLNVSKGLLGIKRSAATKAKIGAASKGRKFAMPAAAKLKIAAAKRLWWAKQKQETPRHV